MKILVVDDIGPMHNLALMLHAAGHQAGGMVMLNTIDLDGKVPSEIQMLPYGVFNTPKYGRLVVDDESLASVMARAAEHKNDMVIDYEHQTFSDPPIAAPAAGWVKIRNLINKGKEGIWAVVDWTPKAKEMIANREYRYFSPVTWTRKNDGKVLGLMGGGLTNIPNIDGMVPLTNKADAGKQQTHKEGTDMKQIAALLGLPETATEEEIVAALQKLIESMNSAVATNKAVTAALALAEGAKDSEITGTIMAMKQSHSQHGTLAQQVAALTAKNAQRDAEELVANAMKPDDKGLVKVLPAQKDWALDYAKKDPEGFKVYVNKTAGVMLTGKVAGDPPAGGGGEMDEAQRQVNKMLGVSDESFKKHNPAA